MTLPSKLPLLLMQGADGIAVGMAARILPHNFPELLEAQINILKKQPLFEPHDEGTPFQVLDKTNLPPEGQDWATKSDYKDRFLKLWQ